MTNCTTKATWIVAMILFTSIFSAPTAAFAHEGGHGRHPATAIDPTDRVAGEVLELSCYLKHGGTADNYRDCTRSPLVRKHFSAALLTADGSLYVLVLDHEEAFKAVQKLVSKHAEASGRTVSKHGLKALVLQGIREVKKSKK